MGDRLVDAMATVGGHARNVEPVHFPVDEHDRHLAGEQHLEGGRWSLRRQHDAVHPLREERFDVAVLLVDVLVRVAKQADVVGVERRLLGGVGDVGEEGVADVGDEQTQHMGPGRAERAGLRVGPVAEGGGRFCDAGTGIGRGCRVAGEHAGSGAERHPSAGGDVADRDAVCGHLDSPGSRGNVSMERFPRVNCVTLALSRGRRGVRSGINRVASTGNPGWLGRMRRTWASGMYD